MDPIQINENTFLFWQIANPIISYWSKHVSSKIFFLDTSIVAGGGDLNPKCLYWKHQEVLVELQGSWLAIVKDFLQIICKIYLSQVIKIRARSPSRIQEYHHTTFTLKLTVYDSIR